MHDPNSDEKEEVAVPAATGDPASVAAPVDEAHSSAEVLPFAVAASASAGAAVVADAMAAPMAEPEYIPHAHLEIDVADDEAYFAAHPVATGLCTLSFLSEREGTGEVKVTNKRPRSAHMEAYNQVHVTPIPHSDDAVRTPGTDYTTASPEEIDALDPSELQLARYGRR